MVYVIKIKTFHLYENRDHRNQPQYLKNEKVNIDTHTPRLIPNQTNHQAKWLILL